MGVAENPGKLGPQLPGTALMAMILPETGVHPGNVGLTAYHPIRSVSGSRNREMPIKTIRA
jgi:hypothetical protein